MKKRLIIGLACLTAGIGLAGCGGSNSTPTETTTAEATTTATTTAETSELTTQTESTTTSTPEKVTEATTYALSEETTNKLYDEIINNYYVIQQSCEGVLYNVPDDVIQLFPKDGSWKFFRDSISNMGTDYYYSIHDLDNNGVKELVIFNGDSPTALYTIIGDEVIPVAFGGYRNQLKISDAGEIYIFSHGGYQDYQFSKFKFSEDGSSLKPIFYKGIDGNNPDGSLIYYSYPSISGKDFFNLEFLDMQEITESEFQQTEDEYNNVECTLEKFPVKASEKTIEETSTNDENNHQGNSAFTEYLRKNFDRDKGSYSKYAIADFDADGIDELALARKGGGIEIIDEEDLSLQYDDYTYINDYTFDSITFLDNGVAYVKKDFYLDSKDYFLINREWLSELGYNPGESGTFLEREIYYIEEYAIFKSFMSGDYMVNTKGYKNTNEIITQEEYEKESQMLNSGNVLDFQVKDFTAENLGL